MMGDGTAGTGKRIEQGEIFSRRRIAAGTKEADEFAQD
jgi:hypothetical protein